MVLDLERRRPSRDWRTGAGEEDENRIGGDEEESRSLFDKDDGTHMIPMKSYGSGGGTNLRRRRGGTGEGDGLSGFRDVRKPS